MCCHGEEMRVRSNPGIPGLRRKRSVVHFLRLCLARQSNLRATCARFRSRAVRPATTIVRHCQNPYGPNILPQPLRAASSPFEDVVGYSRHCVKSAMNSLSLEPFLQSLKRARMPKLWNIIISPDPKRFVGFQVDLYFAKSELC